MDTHKIYGLTPITTNQYYMYFAPKDNYKEDVGGGWKIEHRTPVYESEIKLFLNCVGKKLNEVFGTAYTIVEEFIERAKGQKADIYNIHYLWDWDIVARYGDKWELIKHYYYKGDDTNYIGLGGISTATYGEFTSDDIIESYVNILRDFHESSFLNI